MPRAKVGNVEIEYEVRGEGEPLLLVMGIGAQLIFWDDALVDRFVAGGFQVIRFDHRDIGLSTRLDHLPVPRPARVMGRSLLGLKIDAPYTLSDMAHDVIGLLDHLGIDRAHVVGMSMGGMVAQHLAIEHPHRVRSLTSIMSTPAYGVGAATPAAGQALLSRPASTREGAVERSLGISTVIGSPAYRRDEDWIREAVGIAWDRSNDPVGATRQLAAVVLSPDRRPALTDLTVPTLVVHGEVDPLIQVDGGRETAAAIPAAELMVLPGMGHDLPRALWVTVVDAVVALVHRAEETGMPPDPSYPKTDRHARWGRLLDPIDGQRQTEGTE